MAMFIFNFRKSIFKHILTEPDLKDEFFCSIEYMTQDLDLDLNPKEEYIPEFILKIMNPQQSEPLTFKNFPSKKTKIIINFKNFLIFHFIIFFINMLQFQLKCLL